MQKDIYAIVKINTGKSFDYQSILVITNRSVFVISPTISFIKYQVYITFETLYIYYLYCNVVAT